MRFQKRAAPKVREVDPLIPIMNLVCMLIPLLIFGAVFVQYRTVEVSSPQPVTGPNTIDEDEPSLQLRVWVTDAGFHVRVHPNFRQAWMSESTQTEAQGPDIPVGPDGYDYATLTARLRGLKERFGAERKMILGAEDDVAYDVLIHVMDASRGGEKELFPDVTLTRHRG